MSALHGVITSGVPTIGSCIAAAQAMIHATAAAIVAACQYAVDFAWPPQKAAGTPTLSASVQLKALPARIVKCYPTAVAGVMRTSKRRAGGVGLLMRHICWRKWRQQALQQLEGGPDAVHDHACNLRLPLQDQSVAVHGLRWTERGAHVMHQFWLIAHQEVYLPPSQCSLNSTLYWEAKSMRCHTFCTSLTLWCRPPQKTMACEALRDPRTSGGCSKSRPA